MCRTYKIKQRQVDVCPVMAYIQVYIVVDIFLRAVVMAKEGKNKGMQALALTTTISMEIAITVTLGFWLGRYLDGRFGTEPWIMVAGVLLGMGLGIFSIIQTLERFFKQN